MMKNRLRILLTVAILLIALVTAAAGETADDGVLAGAGFTEIGKDGFYIPMPTGEGWQGGEAWGMRGLFAEATRTDAAGRRLTVQGYSQELSDFVQTANDANRYYDSLRFENERNVVMSNVVIGGYTARLATFSYDQQDGTFAAHGGILLYAREMRLLQVRIYSESETGLEETTPVVRMEDLERVAGMVRFAAEEAPIRHSDVELTISIDGNVPVVPAGGTLQLNAIFGNASIVNSGAGNNGVNWEVVDSGTGLNATAATISDKGTLTADKNVQWASEVVVRVSSTTYDTSAIRKILVTPAAAELSISPTELTFYAGENRTETLRIAIAPEIVPPIGLTWSMSKNDLAEITDNGNGTATVRPLMPGKGTLTVREPGGKAASVKITVLRPVEALALTQKGTPRPGGTVAFSVKLSPYNAGNRKVEWSVNVDESIASINNRGRLRIQKEAPVGTVIRVTCTAVGAPTPVSATAEVTVSE